MAPNKVDGVASGLEELLAGGSRDVYGGTFLEDVSRVLIEHMRAARDRERPVVEFVAPADLRAQLDLQLGDAGVGLQQLVDYCSQALAHSVNTSHPHFYNQLFAGTDPVAVVGEWLTAVANASMYTYEIAPVFTLMEDEILRKLREYVGFEEGDGIFAPGGSLSNLYAMLAARHRACPHIRTQGMGGERLVVLHSAQAHYSIKKMAIVMGLGLDALVPVPCDANGRMLPAQLDALLTQCRADGRIPLLVNAMAGTTVLGAFDDLHAVADVCQRHGVWLHVDAAWGGSVLLSRQHRQLMAGVERADSVTWNPHKMMGIPLQCSCILLKDVHVLREMNECHAEYLFQKDKENYDVAYDTGDKAIQCGRRVDVFKLWLAWKAKGSAGYEQQIDRAFANARYLRDQIVAREGFELVAEPQCTNVCFWYIPPSMRTLPRGPDFDARLQRVAAYIKPRLLAQAMVGYNPLGSLPNFFRMIVVSPTVGPADMDQLLDAIDAVGAAMADLVPSPAQRTQPFF